MPQLLALSVLASISLGGGEITVAGLAPGTVLALLLVVTGLALVLTGYRGDGLALPAVGGLLALSVGAIWGVDADLGRRQLIWIAIGLACFGVVYGLLRRPHELVRYKYTAAVIGIGLVFLTLFIGRDLNESGIRLWIGIGPFNFQPSEILKVLLVIFFAGYLYEYRTVLRSGEYRVGPLRLPPIPYLVPILVLWGTSLLMFAVQRDFGAAVLIFGVAIAMIYVGSGRTLYVVGAAAAFLLGAIFLYRIVPVVDRRVDVWLDPWSRASDAGYQIVQGLIALASGGVLGGPVGAVNPAVVPAATTDYIIAVVGEQLGLAGTIAVVALFLVFFQRGFDIAARARGEFEQLLATGITSTLAIQAVVILAGTLKLAPLTGITLPFVSYGGSSLVANCIMLGILLRLSKESARG